MTLDFNATASISGQLTARIDRALQAARAAGWLAKWR